MLNSERFLTEFNRIEKYLRKITGLGREKPFGALVNTASERRPEVKQYSDDLKEFSDLRNAIIHERTDGHVIAEPNDEAVTHIQLITSVLVSPPKVYPSFRKKVLTLKITDSVADAVEAMFRHSFSQIPIYDDQKFAALLTTDTVARWLGKSVEEDVFSLTETNIKDVLEYAEEQDNYCFLSREAPIFAVLEKFDEYEQAGKRLDAILITQSGKPTETLIGVITVWDIPQIYGILNI